MTERLHEEKAEGHYLDDMDVYLSGERGVLQIEEITLNQRYLHARSFNALRKRADDFKEPITRPRLRQAVPLDTHEARHSSYMQIAMLFPKISSRIGNVVQPAEMPLPCQFVIYYYHLELNDLLSRRFFSAHRKAKEATVLFRAIVLHTVSRCFVERSGAWRTSVRV